MVLPGLPILRALFSYAAPSKSVKKCKSSTTVIAFVSLWLLTDKKPAKLVVVAQMMGR
jgi:hypothetical protein